MQIVNVKVVRPKPPEAGLHSLQDGRARQADVVGSFTHLVPDLARQDQPLPPFRENLPQHLFRLSLVVHVRGVEEVDSRVETLIDHAGRAGLVRLGTQRHGAEGKARDSQISMRQKTIFHQYLPAQCVDSSPDIQFSLSKHPSTPPKHLS